MDAGEEVPGGFLVASGDGAEVFDDIEEALDEVALGIEGEVAWPLHLSIGFGWDDWPDLAHLEMVNEAVAVVGFVSDHRIHLDLLGERDGLSDVMGLAAGEADHQRVAEGIDDGVDLGRQSSARATDRFV